MVSNSIIITNLLIKSEHETLITRLCIKRFILSKENNQIIQKSKNMKKVVLPALLLLASVLFISQPAAAQWAIGASYEMQNENPENGFGVRVERGIIGNLPLLDLSMRAHFSYFNDTNSITLKDIDFSSDIDMYDYGIAAIAGLKLGLVRPYVGLGIGNQQFNYDPEDNQEITDVIPDDASSFYWNGFGGAEISILPFLSPFIEYRIANLTSA